MRCFPCSWVCYWIWNSCQAINTRIVQDEIDARRNHAYRNISKLGMVATFVADGTEVAWM